MESSDQDKALLNFQSAMGKEAKHEEDIDQGPEEWHMFKWARLSNAEIKAEKSWRERPIKQR